MTTRWPLGVALAGMALLGCPAPAEADPVIPLDRDFSLGGGQEATIDGENLRVRFAEVREDSRCPALVNCVWTGRARIAVDVWAGETPPSTVVFTINPAPGQNVQTARVDGYTVTLRRLDPYPQAPEPIPFGDYRATLLVQKA
jgi:hypothetical protein